MREGPASPAAGSILTGIRRLRAVGAVGQRAVLGEPPLEPSLVSQPVVTPEKNMIGAVPEFSGGPGAASRGRHRRPFRRLRTL